MPQTVEEIEVRAKLDQVIGEMTTATNVTKGFVTQLQDVLDYLDKINNKSLGKTANYFGNITNNSKSVKIGASKHLDTYMYGDNVMQLPSGSKTKAAKNAQQAVLDGMQKQLELTQALIDKNKELTKQMSARTAIQKQYADTNAERLKEQQKINKENENYRRYRDKHPELFASGGKNYSWRTQTSRMTDSVERGLNQFGAGGRIIGDVLSSAGALIKAPAVGVMTIFSKLANGMLDFTKSATQAYAEIESIKTQLGVVFSNQTQADSVFSEIAQYAVKSPFGVQQTSELAVLLKQSGVYASDLMSTLRMIGDTAGGNMEKMKRIANNYAQIVSIGKASMLDMRQFAYAGIPIFEAVSKELGVSQQELRKIISEGKVTSDIIEKVFKDLTGINGIFENATEKGAKTLKARLQNLKDAKQLAMSSAGEMIVNAGTTYGKDSVVLNFVSKAEEFFDWMKEHVDTRNIERDVKVIKENRRHTENIKDLIEFAKEIGDEDLEKALKEELKKQSGKYTVDEKRNYYANAYDIYNKKYNEFIQQEKYKNLDEKGIDAFLKEYRAKLDEKFTKAREYDEKWEQFKKEHEVTEGMTSEDISKLNKELEFGYETYLQNKDYTNIQIDVYKNLIDEMNDFRDALRLTKKTTDDMIQADKERTLLTEQQNAFDAASKNIDREGTYANAAEKLYSLYLNGEEYKKQKEEEELKLLKETQQALIKLSVHNSQSGFDITKLSYEDLVKYTMGDTALLSPGNKLQIVTGDKEQTAENRNQYLTQWKTITEKIAQHQAEKNDWATKIALENELKAIGDLIDASDEDFFNSINTARTNQEKWLQAEYDKITDKEIKEDLKTAIELLQKSTFTQELNDKGKAAVIEQEEKGKAEPEYIALYKRIISSATGIPALAINEVDKALNFYAGNLASRSMAGNVLGTAVGNRSMSVDDMTKMLAGTRNTVTLKNGKAAYQIDWEKVRKNIEDFSLQLKTSTENIEAYRKSLNAERETYIKLLSESITTYDTDGKSTRWISANELARNKDLLTQDEVGLNAFGEKIVNQLGEEVAGFNKEGLAVDKDGNVLSNQILNVADQLYDEVKKRLTSIDEKIDKADEVYYKNSILAAERNRALDGNALTYLKLANFSNRDFIDRNSDNILGLFETTLKGKYGDNYESFKNKLAAGDSASVNIAQIILDKIYRDISNMSPEELKAYAEQAEKNRLGAEELSLKDRYDLMLNPQSHYGLGAENGYLTRTILSGLGWDKDTDFSSLGDNLEEIQKNFSTEYLRNELEKLKETFDSLIADSAKLAYISPFEKLGEDVFDIQDGLKTWEDYWDDLGDSMRNIAGDLTKQTGQLIQQAGFSIVTASAMEHNWTGVATGLALAAAGGFASGIGNWLGNKNNKDEDDDKAKKLESLSDQLRELLAQARADALYYEKNLRHKTALGLNEQFSYTAVNDAIITKKGEVIKTSPEDYLIATKTPQALAGNTVVQPSINFSVIDNVGVHVRQEQKQNPDGSIDIMAVIENAVGEYIASPKSDDAFNARNYRLNGRTAIM